MVKKLVFDAQEVEGDVDFIELTLNGEQHTIYRPTSGQIVLMMAAFGEEASGPDAAAALITFYRDITDEDGLAAVKGMLRNPNIPDSLEQVMDLTEKVIEAFTGNPTKQPTDYLPSQKSTGQNSTGLQRPAASTRSRSPRVGSATGSTRASSRD